MRSQSDPYSAPSRHSFDGVMYRLHEVKDADLDPCRLVRDCQNVPPAVDPPEAPKQPRRRYAKPKRSQRGQSVTVAEEPILLTRKQAAERLQIGLTTLDKWSKEPDFPIIRGHRLARIHAAELDEWVKRYTARRSGNYGYRPDLTPPRRRRP